MKKTKGQPLLAFLVVATVLTLFWTVRSLLRDHGRPARRFLGYTTLSEATDEEVTIEQDERYMKAHGGTTREQGEQYVTLHVPAASHDFEEEHRNEAANATGTVTLTKARHSVGRTDAPHVVSPEMPSSEVVSPSVSPRSELGYMLTFSYSDQLTGGVLNLLSLLCLATKFGGVRVVEPLVVNSDLGVNGGKNWTEQIKFRDIYDVAVFEKYVSRKNFNQFVPYETFIKDAPLKVLLVQYRYACGDPRVWNKAREFCDTNGLELIDKVCLTYGRGEAVSIDSLKKQIYSKYKPSEVVILFEVYGGIAPKACTGTMPWRLCGNYTTCERGNFDTVTEPSPTVFSDADSYIQKYMNGASTYISVMVRLERILLARSSNAVDTAEHARHCLTNIVSRWRDIKNRTGITTTFLAMDVGRYGSKGYRRFPERARAVHPAVVQFLSAIYGNETSLEEWEDTFTTVGLGQTKTPGYIAMMQKLIATKGTVLMLVGRKAGSTFHASSIHMFHKFSSKGQLIVLDNDCS